MGDCPYITLGLFTVEDKVLYNTSHQMSYHQEPASQKAMASSEVGENASSHMLSSHNAHFVQNEKRMGGRYSNIALSALILTVPMLVFVCVLVVLVFHYRVESKDTPFDNLRLPEQQAQKGFYYVNISSTILVFIASWSSSLAPALASFALALIAYPVSRAYLRETRAEKPGKLLTPYQLFLTLRFLEGGAFGALWDWVKYLFKWRRQRAIQASPLSTSAFIALISTILATAVFLADTWLHVTTKTVNFIQITPVTTGINYSMALFPGCTEGNNSFIGQPSDSYCSLNIAATAIFLINGTQSIQVLNNVSSTIAVLQYEDTPYTFLGVPPSASLSARDYTAKTYGMQTQCRPVTNECNMNPYAGASTPFHCTDAFSGDVTQAPIKWAMSYFSNGTMESNDTYSGVENPFYFGIAALVNPGGGGGPLVQTNLTAIPEIVEPVHGGVAFVLSCESTMYDIEYDSVNGSVSRFVATASNASVANIWQGVMAFTTGDPGLPNLLQASTLAVFSDSAQELADKMALAYSRVALAIGAQAVVPQPAIAAQERESFLVARVPVAPLFTLIAANLLFVAMGFILAFVALASSGGEVREIQARLSVKGLVADRFESARGRNGVESMEELFEESEGRGSMRVGLDYTEGSGHSYKTWPRAEQ